MSAPTSSGLAKKRLLGRISGTAGVVEIEYNTAIQTVDELIYPPEIGEFVSPGFIDVQVNGFAGVDYNDPSAPREQIAESIRTMFATGVTRFFPTVITGSRERMIG